MIAVIQIAVNLHEPHDCSASNGGSSTLIRPAIGHGFVHFETQKMGVSLRPSRHNSRVNYCENTNANLFTRAAMRNEYCVLGAHRLIARRCSIK